MQSIFVELGTNNVAASDLVACNHNHALVHNPFSWAEDVQESQESEGVVDAAE